MEKTSAIKYSFAKTENGQIINIQDLSKETKEIHGHFFCLGCENEMIPILGTKKNKHFRHKQIEPNCQPETYLHKLAKWTFYQNYKRCLEQNQDFLIQFHVSHLCNHYENNFSTQCILFKELQEFEITKYFQDVRLETKSGEFIPDVVLLSNDSRKEKIFIEVVVTHESSISKIQSGHRIIEIKIQTEDDIKVCQESILTESQNITFLNFKKSIIKDYCQGSCSRVSPHLQGSTLFRVLVFYADDTCIHDLDYQDLLEIASSESVVSYRLLPFVKSSRFNFYSDIERFYKDTLSFYENVLGEFFRNEVVRLFSSGAKIKSCFLCRYHAINQSFTYDGSVFCKFLKKSGNSNMAYECKYFKADKKVFEKYLLSVITLIR